MPDPTTKSKPPSADDALAALKFYVDLANSEKQAIWARHATMVVGNSLLINAVRSDPFSWTNVSLCVAGLVLCILWGIMTWVGWTWFYKAMADANKLPIDPLLNPFSSFPNLGDRRRDKIFMCTMAVIVIFGLVYVVALFAPLIEQSNGEIAQPDVTMERGLHLEGSCYGVLEQS